MFWTKVGGPQISSANRKIRKFADLNLQICHLRTIKNGVPTFGCRLCWIVCNNVYCCRLAFPLWGIKLNFKMSHLNPRRHLECSGFDSSRKSPLQQCNSPRLNKTLSYHILQYCSEFLFIYYFVSATF
jgi:hypothetical protein